MTNDTRRFIQNVSLDEARAIRDDFDELKAKVSREGRDYPILESLPLFDVGEIVYGSTKRVLGLEYDGTVYGFDEDHGRRIDALYKTIDQFLDDLRNPKPKDNFKKDF